MISTQSEQAPTEKGYVFKQGLRALNWSFMVYVFKQGLRALNWSFMVYAVLYPAIIWECCFFDERSKEKNCCAAGESEGDERCSKPYLVGPGTKLQKIFGYFAF